MARARTIELTGEDRDALDQRFPAGRILRRGRSVATGAALRPDAEVVIVMGVPGAGKTTLARALEGDGFVRFNRDEAGGTLRDLIPQLDRALASGTNRIVLDNTYASRKARAEVVEAAAARGVPVRCVWLTTTLEDAQYNAACYLALAAKAAADNKALPEADRTARSEKHAKAAVARLDALTDQAFTFEDRVHLLKDVDWDGVRDRADFKAVLAKLDKRFPGRPVTPPDLLASQYATLEPLGPDEDGIVVDVALDPDSQVREAMAGLGLEAE